MLLPKVDGIVSISSMHSVNDTVKRLEAILESKSIKVFGIVDHSGGAERAGTSMLPTKVVFFGNPTAGTPLMLAAPTTAIDLPLKILVAEDASGQVTLSWTIPGICSSAMAFPPSWLRTSQESRCWPAPQRNSVSQLRPLPLLQ
jgi:uncharacterized protein (DUF302 family)